MLSNLSNPASFSLSIELGQKKPASENKFFAERIFYAFFDINTDCSTVFLCSLITFNPFMHNVVKWPNTL